MSNENKLYKLFEDNFKRYPEKIGIIITEKKISYKELSERVLSWSNFFNSIGVREGDRLVLSTDDRLDFISSWLALWKLGAIPIPTEPTSGVAEISRALESGKPQWICSENPEHLKALTGKLEEFSFELRPNWIIRKIYCNDNIESIKNSAFYTYTSGTTGAPKCVMYNVDATIAIITSLIDAFKLTSSDTFMTPLTPSLPSVIFTAILPSLASGATLVLIDEPIPSTALRVLRETNTTVFFTVPYFYRLMINAMKVRKINKFTNLRLCVATSAYLDEDTFNEFYKLTSVPIRSIFCSSEAFYCTFNPNNDIEKLRKSVGICQKGVKLKIVDKIGKDVAPFNEGEIVVSGTHKSSGYFCKPELEKMVFRDGWVYTGDLGYMDEEGYLYITGRVSDTVNVGGHLVNPQEVESVLISYPGISEAMMVGEKDEEIGEIVVAKVVLKSGVEIDTKNVIQYCKKMLLPYKVPSRIEVIDNIPKSRYGKIRRLS
ncbi:MULTISPECIES: class I adenylate-forming enzyme family protein [Clostridium]|uniref:class I adenylate-forming enzyme family protein n=1 Tax=Clostridium TaxID=1485 RepID=UPI000826E45D|nr:MULTISPECIES: AMP-binding protein [Clostridium]